MISLWTKHEMKIKTFISSSYKRRVQSIRCIKDKEQLNGFFFCEERGGVMDMFIFILFWPVHFFDWKTLYDSSSSSRSKKRHLNIATATASASNIKTYRKNKNKKKRREKTITKMLFMAVKCPWKFHQQSLYALIKLKTSSSLLLDSSGVCMHSIKSYCNFLNFS